MEQRNQPKSQISWLDIYPGDILWRETHGSLNPLCFKSSMVIISKLKLGFSGDFHKVGDNNIVLGQDLMVGQNLMVGHVLLGGKSDQSYLAMSFDTYL